MTTDSARRPVAVPQRSATFRIVRQCRALRAVIRLELPRVCHATAAQDAGAPGDPSAEYVQVGDVIHERFVDKDREPRLHERATSLHVLPSLVRGDDLVEERAAGLECRDVYRVHGHGSGLEESRLLHGHVVGNRIDGILVVDRVLSVTTRRRGDMLAEVVHLVPAMSSFQSFPSYSNPA